MTKTIEEVPTLQEYYDSQSAAIRNRTEKAWMDKVNAGIAIATEMNKTRVHQVKKRELIRMLSKVQVGFSAS